MLKRIREILRAFREHVHALSWVGRVVRAYRRFLIFVLALNIVQMLMGIFFSVYVKTIIDGADQARVRSRLFLYAALTLGWTLVNGVLRYCTRLYFERIAFSVRSQVFHAVLRADWRRVSGLAVGDLNSRINGDAREISDYACYTFPTLAGAVMQLCVTAAIVYSINRGILLVLLAGAVVAAVLMLGFRLGLKPLQKQLREREVASTAYQTELCGNLITVKTLCREEAGERRFQDLQNEKVRAMRAKYRFSCASDTSLGLFSTWATCWCSAGRCSTWAGATSPTACCRC